MKFLQARVFYKKGSSLISVIIFFMTALVLMSWISLNFEYVFKSEPVEIKKLNALIYLEYLTLVACEKIETLEKLPAQENYKIVTDQINSFYDKARLKNLCSGDLYIFTLNYKYDYLADSVTQANNKFFNVPVPQRFFPPVSNNDNAFLIRAFTNFDNDSNLNIMLQTVYSAYELNGHVKLNQPPLLKQEIIF